VPGNGDIAVVQIAVPVLAIIAGLLSRTWQRARLITIIGFMVTTAVQTPMVIASDDIESPLVYWSIQVLTLLVGLGLAWAAFTRKQRRASAAVAGRPGA
jgi:predicted tellurium resistance membrane protein TerC